MIKEQHIYIRNKILKHTPDRLLLFIVRNNLLDKFIKYKINNIISKIDIYNYNLNNILLYNDNNLINSFNFNETDEGVTYWNYYNKLYKNFKI